MIRYQNLTNISKDSFEILEYNYRLYHLPLDLQQYPHHVDFGFYRILWNLIISVIFSNLKIFTESSGAYSYTLTMPSPNLVAHRIAFFHNYIVKTEIKIFIEFLILITWFQLLLYFYDKFPWVSNPIISLYLFLSIKLLILLFL